MATLDDIEKRVTALEERVGVADDDLREIPHLVTMHFDLLRAEMRAMKTELQAMERRLEKRFDTKIDTAVRSIAELIAERDAKT